MVKLPIKNFNCIVESEKDWRNVLHNHDIW